jgi:hypothetical protein
VPYATRVEKKSLGKSQIYSRLPRKALFVFRQQATFFRF